MVRNKLTDVTNNFIMYKDYSSSDVNE